MPHTFNSMTGTKVKSLYRYAKDGGIIVENKHVNELEINLERVIIIFKHRFSVVNVCCAPRSILMPTGRNKR